MDNNNQRSGAAVDDILQELKGKPPASAATAGAAGKSVDDILAEMGKAPQRPPVPKAPVAPVASGSPAAAPARPAAPPPAAPRPVAAPPPVAAPVTPPAPVAPQQPAPAPGFVPEAELAPPEPAAPAPPASVLPTEAELAAQPPKRKKRNDLTATIYDIDLEQERTEVGPRMGKAAALDRVDGEKYQGDTELLSWFSGEGDEPLPTSKKELRKQEKMRKRREAAERRAEKRREKDGDTDYYDLGGGEESEDVKVWGGDSAAASPPTSEPDSWVPGEDFLETATRAQQAPAAAEPAPTTTVTASAATAPAPVVKAPAPAEPPVSGDTASFTAAMGAKPAAPPVAPATPAAPRAPAPAASAPTAPVGGAPKAAAPRPAPPVSGDTATFTAPSKAAPATPTAPPVPGSTASFTAAMGATQAAKPAAPAAPAPGKPLAPAGDTATFTPPGKAAPAEPYHDTKSFDIEEGEEPHKVPTAAYTQEFDTEEGAEREAPEGGNKSLYLDDMVDDRFRDFFSESVIVDSKELVEAEAEKVKSKRRRKKSRSAVLTGEFAKLAEQAERAERAAGPDNVEADDDFEDYDRPQDAEAVEEDIATLCATLTRRAVATGVIALLLLWLGLTHAGMMTFAQIPVLEDNPLVFAIVYLVLVLAAVVVNFTTVATGTVGLAGEPTVDTPPALAAIGGLAQGVLLLVNVLMDKPPVSGTLFGAAAALILSFNALGKRVRAGSILANFKLASAGFDHSAAYVLDNSHELAYNITRGLNEEYPTLLISRPTALVKGFLRQSFSQRAVDRRARIMGWVLFGVSAAAAVVTWFLSEDLFGAVTAFAATLCISAPLSSSLVSGVPSMLLQKATSRIGAVVPGWSAIEELGEVNVVMAGARDIFPPSAVQLKGIKTFEKERIDLAILYAASVLIAGCDTLKDIFLAVIQGKSDMLYKVESLTTEPGRGFTAWVQNSRIVIGTREMLQKHDVEPPSIEVEMKFVPQDCFPVYLAVSGKLFAMFIIRYTADADVESTLQGLVRGGVSLLIDSNDMNVSAELVERVYDLPSGVVKVLGYRELEMLEPLTNYLPESEGVMTHIGTFTSFIGGMRAAASCAAAEKMSNIVQISAAALAAVLCILLVLSQGLTGLSIFIVLLYQLGWALLVSALPFVRRY